MFNHKSLNEVNFWFLKKKEVDDISSIEKDKKKLETNLTQQV
jgi:hypothetical protein